MMLIMLIVKSLRNHVHVTYTPLNPSLIYSETGVYSVYILDEKRRRKLGLVKRDVRKSARLWDDVRFFRPIGGIDPVLGKGLFVGSALVVSMGKFSLS